MKKFKDAMGWLDQEIAKVMTRLEQLRGAREVLGEYAPAAPAARAAKPKRAPKVKRGAVVAAFALAPKPDRRAAIAAAAARRPAPATDRDERKPRACGCAWTGKHRATCTSKKSKAAPKPKAEPAPAPPAPVVDALQAERNLRAERLAKKLGAVVPPSAPVLKLPNRARRGKSQRLCRCTVLVESEFGSGGRGLRKTAPCGETVWQDDRQKHLHREHGIIDPAIEGYFEVLRDPEEEAA